MPGTRKGGSLVIWRMRGETYRECNVKCRRSRKVVMDMCPCTGLCKGKSTKEAIKILRTSEVYTNLIHYARSRDFVEGIRLAPEVVQIEIDFSSPDHQDLTE